ncbi:MAG: M28 family peptidase [Anaerolineae bacterium]|nr:M28 family peptidase [Anaerolineae bacterium]
MRNRLPFILFVVALLASCGSAPLTFSGEEAYRQAVAQTALGPRPTGSEAGWATGDYIIERLDELGWDTESQITEFQGVKLRNIVGRAGAGPVIIVGAHYDTRPHADLDPVNPDQWILGANDGASGVAVLLELARVLDKTALPNEVWLTFFDAEDRGNLEGWPFSVGASYMAQNLTVTPQAVIVLDMVGDRDQQFYYERNSDPDLLIALWEIAASLGYQDQFIPQVKWSIIDDHMPFAALGLPAADVIDFDYPAWHTAGDTLDQISAESLERIGRVMEVYLEQ